MNRENFEQAKQYALQRLERELPPHLLYHSLFHTRDDVVPAAERLAAMEGIEEDGLFLLLTGAWFHDLGFLEGEPVGHESASMRLASEVLPGFGYRPEQIEIVQNLIRATIMPQRPRTLLEQILADADLDMCGREDFMPLSDKLRREHAYLGKEFSDVQWYTSQIKFVAGHAYFTASARALRDAGKLKSIASLQRRLDELGAGT